MKILLLTPPMTQLNTPYPATAYLTGFLKQQNYQVTQRDVALELLLNILTRSELTKIYHIIENNYAAFDDEELPDSIYHFMSHYQDYQKCVEPVIHFLQGKDPSLALRICSREFLPEGVKFEVLYEMEETGTDMLAYAFGSLGIQDKAKYLATLFIDDLITVITEGIAPYFEISRYGERLSASNPSFDDLYDCLQQPTDFITKHIQNLVDDYLQQEQPNIIGLSVPFPGNMLGALKIAQHCKHVNSEITIVMGGGFINTELRNLKDPRVFEFVDYICLDDGERPLLTLLEYLNGQRNLSELHRTYYLKYDKVIFKQNPTLQDIPQFQLPAPSYDGLALNNYLSLCEMLNPMHRIWSDGRWNKLTVAHGCYWAKCSFCDISLDYIARYQDSGAERLVDHIEKLIAETGQTGFHFVDEAAPPKALFALAEKLIERQIIISWWGNIRFEKTFTAEKCRLLADSGCIAVSGGLEVASDRLLKLMQKGVTVEQVARVTKAFSDTGILVHAYLMYGFPTQTATETVDSLERVRQLMLHGCIHSAYWHRFAATIHSPVAMEPEKYQITLKHNVENDALFAENDIDFVDSVNADHEMLGRGLKKALYNYMHGIGFEIPVHHWFEKTQKKTTVKMNFIEKALTS